MDHDELDRAIAELRRGPLLPLRQIVAPQLDRDMISQRLPHRGSMLLIDGADVDPVTALVRATRTLDAADPTFTGHFPGAPVYPGTLLTEMIGQAGLLLLAPVAEVALVRIDRALFLTPVRPRDVLDIHAKIIADEGFMTTLGGQVFVRERLALVAVVTVLVKS